MKAIIEEADSETAAKMQELALAEVGLQIIFQLVLKTLFFLSSVVSESRFALTFAKKILTITQNYVKLNFLNSNSRSPI